MDPTGLFYIHIDNAKLSVRRVKISSSIQLAHAKARMKSTAKYPLTRVEVKAGSTRRGINGESLDNIILGALPQRIIVGFEENKAYNGDHMFNPYNFENFGTSFLCLYADGVQIPSKPFETGFSKKKYVDAH